MSENPIQSDVENESLKNDESVPKQEQRKRRRKRVDEDGRDYTCACGKSYLSYPALYTHVKTKHNGETVIAEKLKIPHEQLLQVEIPKEKQNLSKSLKTLKKDPQQEQFSIKNLKQFLFKQFVKEKTQQTLIQLKNTLKLQQDQVSYINHIIHLADNIQLKFQEENKNLYSNSKSQNSSGIYTKQENPEMIHAFHSSPEFKKCGQINLIKNMIEKNQKDRNGNNIERKGFTPCLFPIQQFSRKNIIKEDIGVDDILGMFLSDFLKTGQHNEMINQVVTYFLCLIRQFFNKKQNEKANSSFTGECLIEDANEMVGYLTAIQNPYIRQPIVICKVLFFLMRWMFKQQLTEKMVKFNQAGS